ncbi:hypothetical protein HUK80_14855 [Flavobacterium sp. MAH-1]|uniref:histidine kinase n=1 Tax=Flavobacterium agri TaxID=2743471 RepID=A0A7Y8Y458_9FLAO|nr:ATP-binding protein [Flavobacterium agri]NUY82182.1 hypothetical protein [Flavobacterium agri]NYA72206.1 hypothetical protein [Flavobacterium agri]
MNDKIVFGILISLIFVCTIIVFCAFLIKLYINKIRSYTAQLYQKDLDLQKALTQTVIETQEQVLQNISQDLHDDAGQQLTYINFQIEALRLDSAQNNTTLEPLSEAVKKLSESIRNLSHSLSNQLLMSNDLMKAIASESERLNKTGRIAVSFNIPQHFDKVFDTNEKTVLYRIFQESMNNILKHSKATYVNITMTDHPFEMVISDDGKGFDASDTSGLGVANMKQRATSIGYEIDISSVPGTGTIIRLQQNDTYGKNDDRHH